MKTFLMAMVVWFIVMVGGVVLAHCTEPTTIIRKPGKVGERVEIVGKGAKENAVRVRAERVINGAVITERIVVTGADVFVSTKAAKERKAAKKETPQPKSIKAEAVPLAVKKAVGK